MCFTTRKPNEPCDKGVREGHFHIRGEETPPSNATQIHWEGREGLRNGEHSVTGGELDTTLHTSDGTTWKYSAFRGEWHANNYTATLPGDQKNISKVNMVEHDHFAARQQMDED